jgi:cell division protein FtsW
MRHFDVEKAQFQITVPFFYACVLLLTGVGLVTLYTSSYEFAELFFKDSNYFINRQLAFAAVGIVLFFVFSRINIEKIRKFILPLLIAAAVLCILPLIPGIGVEKNGALRWIKIGPLTYQPSEMVKLALPLYLAHILDKKQDYFDSFTAGVLPPVLVTGLFFSLIYIQNNFSTAAFLVFNALMIFFLAGIQYRYFISAIFILTPISALLIFTKEHRVWRLVSFIKPEWDLLGAGYQVNESRKTIISGGLFGKGLGQGTRKVASVPEIHSDFIFSAYVEEMGFLGIIFFFVMFAVLAVLGYRAAMQSDTVFKRLLAGGLTTMIRSQALLNVAVVSGALPATGIPLPFFSAGGSSLVTTLVSAGLIANIARKKDASLAGGEEMDYVS